MDAADAWDRLSAQQLFLDGTSTPLLLDREQVERFFLPLASAVLERLSQSGGVRKIAANAGPPGSGKSSFAVTLTALLNILAGSGSAALVGMDGWHYPNAYLDSHTIDRDGQVVAMRKIKGSPETFDAAGLGAFLSRARASESAAYPIYSRALHDPIPEGAKLEPGTHIIVLEGNYLLLDEDPWRKLRPLYDLTIFLTAEPETLLAGLRDRHLRGGKLPEATEAQIQVDRKNMERVLRNSVQADYTVQKADSWKIERVQGLHE